MSVVEGFSHLPSTTMVTAMQFPPCFHEHPVDKHLTGLRPMALFCLLLRLLLVLALALLAPE